MRKSRFFQQDAYISVDFLTKESESVSMKDIDETTSEFSITLDPGEGKKPKEILFDKPEVTPRNAIKDELESFYYSIVENKEPEVSIVDGTEALALAHQILEKMDDNAKIISTSKI